MQWTGLNELREKYLHYFETKGHLRLGSFPLVPKNDPSLLLINSGMAPMKKWFLGQEEPPRHRVTTCQKCIRTRILSASASPPATAPSLRCWATSPSRITSRRGHSLGLGVPDQGAGDPRPISCTSPSIRTMTRPTTSGPRRGHPRGPHGPPGQGGQLLGARLRPLRPLL